jgi:hypothetical protein
VRRCAWLRGYILSIHCGGATSVCQANDTDLHAPFKRLYIELETAETPWSSSGFDRIPFPFHGRWTASFGCQASGCRAGYTRPRLWGQTGRIDDRLVWRGGSLDLPGSPSLLGSLPCANGPYTP